MPNNNSNMIDFSHIKPAQVRAQFERAEMDRVNNDLDAALKRMNTLNAALYGSWYMLGFMPIIMLLYIRYFANDDEHNNNSNITYFLLTLMTSVMVKERVKPQLLNMFKYLNIYKTYLYEQKTALLTVRDLTETDLLEFSALARSIVNNEEKRKKSFDQALIYCRDAGLSPRDTMLLHLAVRSQGFGLHNANFGINPDVQKLLDANIDPNSLVASNFSGEYTIVFVYALTNSWRAVSELLDRFPDLDVKTCPQSGSHKGKSVLALSAISSRWDICARIISSFNPDLEQIMEGHYKNRDMDCFGKQIIWVMARAGKNQLVRAMINKGATVNTDSLKKIITCCDMSVIEFGIEKGAFTKQQVIDLCAECEFETPLLFAVVELSLWDELQDVVQRQSQPADVTIAAIVRKFLEYGDTRYLNQLRLLGRSEIKRRIAEQLKKEVAENVIIKTLLEYSTVTIKAFINLNSSRLQEMFDPISNMPTVVDPVRVSGSQNTTNLYERITITKWIREQYARDNAEGNILPSQAAHPENREGIDLDNLVELSAEEKAVMAGKVRTIMDSLVVEAKNQARPAIML